MNCTKAIIPVAGYGTRRLPITKAIEKCMLPVLNRPVIDYIVQDCIAAGIREFYFVVGEDCTQLRQYYGRNPLLEQHLHAHGKEQLLPLIMPPGDCTFEFIVQTADVPYGTSVPVWLCRDLITENEKVLVIMGDQFMFHDDGVSEAKLFLQAAQKAGTPSAMLALEVPHNAVSNYGILATKSHGDFEHFDYVIEKPPIDKAPTNLINASFYLFDKQFLYCVDEDMGWERAGEYMITDPLNTYVRAGNAIAVIRSTGEYLDCGTVTGWLHANQRVLEAEQRKA